MTDYNLWLDNDRQARLLLPLGKNTREQLWTLNFIVGYSIIGLAPGVTAPATHAETEPDADGSNVSAVCLLRKNRFFLRRQTPGSGPQPSARLCQSHDWQQCNQEAWILFFSTAISSWEMQPALWLASSLEPEQHNQFPTKTARRKVNKRLILREKNPTCKRMHAWYYILQYIIYRFAWISSLVSRFG